MTTAFTFNAAPLATLNSGTYCVFPVSTIPLVSNTLSQDVSGVPGFLPVILTGRNLTATGWIFNDFEFPFFNYTTDTVGFVVSRLVGGSPSPADKLVLFCGFGNSLNQDIVQPPDSFTNSFSVDPVKGLLERIPVYRYTSGASYVPAPAVVPQGTVYLAGTRNNTIAFANPTDASRMTAWRATDGSSVAALYDRTAGNDGQADHILDMRLNKLRVGAVLLRTNTPSITNVIVYGSNLIDPLSLTTGTTNATFNNASLWTALNAPISIPPNTWGVVQSTDNTTFWSYLKISSSNQANNIGIVEFLASTFQSRTLNMVP